MKFSIFAFAAAVTLLSLTTAAVLPHRTYLLKDLVALHSNEARLDSEDTSDYYKFWDLRSIGLWVTYIGALHSIDLVYQLVNSTEGFDATVVAEIEQKMWDTNDAFLALSHEYGANETPYDPMSEVATKFHKFVAMERELIDTAQRSILRLLKQEKPALILRAQIIFTLADTAMTVAWIPTFSFLHQFLPSQ